MSEDKRDVLEVLRYELNFLEQGGYGNWYSTPWGPASIFQDSLTCPNHGDPTRSHACHECLLYDFVPEQFTAGQPVSGRMREQLLSLKQGAAPEKRRTTGGESDAKTG